MSTYALCLSGLRPAPETHDRLAALTGGSAKADATVAKYKEQLQQLRTIDLGKVAKETGSAEFFVLLSRGKGSDATVEAVKFASGDEKLKAFTDALRTAEYRLTFPDDTPVKILRRGILSCSTATGTCSFVLMLPDDVRTVD
jgi:hypothetical protein